MWEGFQRSDMETLEEYFSTRVSTFLDDTGLSPTRFGRMALGDPNLMRQIKRGRSLRLRTADRVLAFISGFGRESGGARRPPTRPRYRKPASRAKRRKRNRAMSEQQTEAGTTPSIRFVRLPEVMARTGLSRSTIYVMVAAGRFPKPVPLGARAVGWIESELDEWFRWRIAKRRSVEETGTGRGLTTRADR